jgi:hypothetical protein
MTLDQLDELIASLPKGRTLFHYDKDWYAIELLKHHLTQPTKVADIKKGSFGKLLEKPKIKSLIGSLGSNELNPQDLQLLAPSQPETFRLSADRFDGWIQTSRKGKHAWNLVLQLNLNESDARFLDHYKIAKENDPFEYSYHPINKQRHRTLAWARLDIDLDNGEALIEEIQNDRIREARELYQKAMSSKEKRIQIYGDEYPTHFFTEYWDRYLKSISRYWDEAMLTAAIHFIRKELGIRSIFYHTPESGDILKGGGADGAPRSIYTKLPSKFCFQQTEQKPSFLKKRIQKARYRGAMLQHMLL